MVRRSLIAAGFTVACVIPVASFGQTPSVVTPAPVTSATAAAPSPTATASPAPTASGAAETVDPAVVARAKDWLHRAQTGTIDRTQLDTQINTLMTDSLVAQVAGEIGPLGEPSAFTFIEKRRVGSVTGYRFLATFKGGRLYEIFAVNDAGKISGLRFLPAQ